MEINLTTAAIYAIVERSLSIIGKRSVDENGNLMFKDITLGSREQGIIADYISSAMSDLAAEMSDFVSASTDTSITITLPSNHNAQLDSLMGKACQQYCVSYALYSWFTITAPRLAEKYLGDSNNQLAAIRIMVHNKKEPAPSSADYDNVNGTVE